METYKVIFSKEAAKDYAKIHKSYPGSQKTKVNKIIGFLYDNPYYDVFGWEHHKYTGRYSYELNKKDRVYFTIDEREKVVNLLSCLGHYDDH